MKNLRFTHKLYLGVGFFLLLYMAGNSLVNTMMMSKTFKENYHRELMNITESVYQISYNTYLTNQHWVDNNLKVADHYIKGRTHLNSEQIIDFEIENQITHQKKIRQIPAMHVQNNVGLNELVSKNTEIVDYITRQIGGTVTIFQLIQEGLLRISTSVKRLDGTPAIGTYIPIESEVYQTIIQGDIYRGRAYVVNDWFITAYKPIYENNILIGVIYVGIKQTELDELKETIANLHLEQTYFPFIIDIEGNVVIHHSQDTGNIYHQKDLNGKAYIQEVCDDIQQRKKKEGELTFTIHDLEGEVKKRQLHYKYLPQMQWIVATSIDENIIEKPIIRQATIVISTAVLLFIVVFLFIILSAQSFTRQLNALSSSVSRFAAKDFLARSPIISKDEIGKLASTFNTMADKLKDMYENLELKVSERTKELNEKNQKLQKQKLEIEHQREELQVTLESLKETQSQLIQSEKMAALGQLIAGIAHEINTPLGAINASVNNVTDSIDTTISDLPRLVKTLLDSELKLFLRIMQLSKQQADSLSSKARRQLKRETIKRLEDAKIDHPERVADNLIYMNIYDDLEKILPLLSTPNAQFTLSSARNIISLRKNTDNITLAVTKASNVVLALKKFTHRELEGEKEPADIIDGLETVLTIYNNHIKQGVEVIKDFDPLPEIYCFPDELNQVWANLIHNALQAMQNKGTLTLKIRLKEKQLEVMVQDTGEGIADDIRDKIFEPFFTTKKAGEGSGLGLDIVNQIIEKHNGKIEFNSKVGEGTTFTVSIPLD